MLVADLLTKVLAKRELVCAIPEFCTCKERDPGGMDLWNTTVGTDVILVMGLVHPVSA